MINFVNNIRKMFSGISRRNCCRHNALPVLLHFVYITHHVHFVVNKSKLSPEPHYNPALHDRPTTALFMNSFIIIAACKQNHSEW